MPTMPTGTAWRRGVGKRELFVVLFLLLPALSVFGQVTTLHDQASGVSQSKKDMGLAPASGSLKGSDEAGIQGDDRNDHKARIFDVHGEVRVLKHGSDQWVSAQKGLILEVGDQILTGKTSHVDIAYDSYFLNIARIEEKTKAEFRSIEPTDLHMEDGTIFSALDGLEVGSKYQISTPTAVAGVRGTHLYAEAEAGLFTAVACTVDPHTDHVSQVSVDLADGRSFLIHEDQQLNFDNPQAPVIQEVDPNVAAFDRDTMDHVNDNFGDRRQEGEEALGLGRDDSGDEKAGDKPGDGGDTGGAGGQDAGTSALAPPSMLGGVQVQGPADANLNAAIDSALETFSAPPETEGDSEKQANSEGLRGEEGDEESDSSGSAQGADSPKPDAAKLREFLALGSAGTPVASHDSGGTGSHIAELAKSMGFTAEDAHKIQENFVKGGDQHIVASFMPSHDFGQGPLTGGTGEGEHAWANPTDPTADWNLFNPSEITSESMSPEHYAFQHDSNSASTSGSSDSSSDSSGSCSGSA